MTCVELQKGALCERSQITLWRIYFDGLGMFHPYFYRLSEVQSEFYLGSLLDLELRRCAAVAAACADCFYRRLRSQKETYEKGE